MDTIIELGKVTEETKGDEGDFFELIDDDHCGVLKQAEPAGCG